jgi:hypothetical protein
VRKPDSKCFLRTNKEKMVVFEKTELIMTAGIGPCFARLQNRALFMPTKNLRGHKKIEICRETKR